MLQKVSSSIVSVKNGDSTQEVSAKCAEEESYIKFRM